jgi:hypothetical protein
MGQERLSTFETNVNSLKTAEEQTGQNVPTGAHCQSSNVDGTVEASSGTVTACDARGGCSTSESVSVDLILTETLAQ